VSRPKRAVDPDRATINLLLLLSQRIDRPCPTRRELVAQTGYPYRDVMAFLLTLQDRGLIEIERSVETGVACRRMRIAGGQWTGWTERGRKTATSKPPARP